MKIKTWLLISYFIVMILPLLSAYFLFASITSYHNDQKVEEYYEAYSHIQNLKGFLKDIKLFEVDASKKQLEEHVDDQLSITLYNKDGLVLYSPRSDQNAITKELLYQDLYVLQQGLREFTYKEPVFEDGEIVGLFEISIAREELISTITKRAWIVTILFVLSFIVIYLTITFTVHQRLNKRLYGLMDEMSAFASGNSYTETETGNDEIGELKQHFYTMRKQIKAAQEAIALEQKEKEYMVATISHDLKTPLTSIKAYAESLDESKKLSKEERESYRNVIIDKADFMKQMLDDLTVHTLLQAHDYELKLVTVDGEEFFDMLVSGYEALCKKNNVQLTAWNQVKGTYDVNPKQLMRVADNLMMNAIQHTPKAQKICFATLSEASDLGHWLFEYVRKSYTFNFSKFAYIIVQNEGEGISEDKIDYLFDPLYQVDQARSKKDAHGTGLGLSITRQIIEKHGGTVDAISKENSGACFICSIPKRREKID